MPIVAFFVSGNKSIEVKLRGFLIGSTTEKGLFIATEWPENKPGGLTPSFMRLAGVHGSWARLKCENMPVIPAWLVRRCLDDPRRIPYLFVWKDERHDGEIKEAVRLARFECLEWTRVGDSLESRPPRAQC